MSNAGFSTDDCSERSSALASSMIQAIPLDLLGDSGQADSALGIIAEQTRSRRTKSGLLKLAQLLKRGVPHSKALLESANELPPAMRRLIETGFETGRWDAIIQCSLDRPNRGAYRRPQFWMFSACVIALCWMIAFFVGFVLIVLVPEFSRMYQDFNTPIRGVTSSLVQTSAFLNRRIFNYQVWQWMLVGWTILNALCLFVVSSKWFQSRASSFPLIGRSFYYAAVSDLCHQLATLSDASLPLKNSLQIAGHSIGDCRLNRSCQATARVIQQGVPVDVAVSESGLPIPLNMASTGDWTLTEFAESLRGLSEIYAYRCNSVYQKQWWLLGIGTVLGMTLFVGLSFINLVCSLITLLNILA